METIQERMHRAAHEAVLTIVRSGFLAVFVAIAFGATAAHSAEESGDPVDFTSMSIEELMNIPVYAVSRYAQPISKAPSSVSIVTADDIKTYGYRTVADILNSLSGFYLTYDRNYIYVGVRGFSPTGDYNNRVLILINGHRHNDALYDAASIDWTFPLDVDLIDRVEVARGPSSSVYGNNAFFAVVNIITRSGGSLDALELSGQVASHDTYQGRGSFGHVYSNGVELLVSGSWYDSEGEDRLYFKDFDDPETNNGIAEKGDGENWQNAFMRLSYHNLTVQMAYSSRDKDVPTAYEGAFNANLNTIDDYAFVDVTYDHTFTGDDALTTRLYYDYYRYDGIYPYEDDDASVILNVDGADADWYGAELQYSRLLWDRHRLTVGGDYRVSSRLDQFTFDRDPFFQYFDDKQDSDSWGVYGQDEITVGDNLIFSAGLRYDHYDTFGGTANPRLALVYNPVERTVMKAMYGEAFRAPNVYELYYDIEDFEQKANPDLDPETIQTAELVWEQGLGEHQRLSVAGFYNEIDDFISQEEDPEDELLVFRNVESVETIGVEVELLGRWDNGVRSRVSYTYQDTEDNSTDEWLVNSPRNLAKLNVTIPLIREKLRLGTELLYASERKTLAGDRTDDEFVVNATLFSLPFNEDLEVSATVYNLFDQENEHPGGPEHTQDILEQSGRTFRAKVTYRF